MPPITLLIKPASSMCNMRCKYCFYADVADHRKSRNYGFMSDETLETMVKLALRYAEGYCGFAFQGGEPTLSGLDFFRRLIKLQKNYNVNNVQISNSIQTNGFNIDEEWAAFLAKNRFLVGLSLDGPKEIHDRFRLDAAGNGTFSRVMRAAALFEKHKVEYNILCVVNNIVAGNGAKIYHFFKQKGFRYLQFIPCLDSFDDDETHDFSLTPENYASFLKSTFELYYRDFKSGFKQGNYISIRNFDNYVSMLMGNRPESCGMNGVCTCYFVVESDGSTYPCDFYVLDKYRMGNIKLQSFSQLAKSEPAVRFVQESYSIDDTCKKCPWFPICRGGCRRNREPFLDGKPVLNRYCFAYKEFFNDSFTRLKELAAIAGSMKSP